MVKITGNKITIEIDSENQLNELHAYKNSLADAIVAISSSSATEDEISAIPWLARLSKAMEIDPDLMKDALNEIEKTNKTRGK